MRLETKQKRVRCLCSGGHPFVTGIFVSLDVSTQPEITQTFSDGGTQLVRCPECGEVWPIAEPVVLHDPAESRVGLFIPQILAHRELDARAELMAELAGGDPDSVPAYAPDFEVILGEVALNAWLAHVKPSEDTQVTHDKNNAEEGDDRIHAAFADLMGPDSLMPAAQRPSGFDLGDGADRSFEEGFETSPGVDVPAPKATSAPPGRLSSKPARRYSSAGAKAQGPRSGIDFAGLMSDEDEGPDDSTEVEEDGRDSMDDLSFDLADNTSSDSSGSEQR